METGEAQWKENLQARFGVYKFDEDVSTSDVQDFITQTLESLGRELAEKLKEGIEMEHYDVMVCSQCGNFVRERFSHNSEDGFSECHGKKLERKTGDKMADTDRNYNIKKIMEDIISVFKDRYGVDIGGKGKEL